MTSEPVWNNGPEVVEKQLWRVCKKLKEKEVTADILGRMAREGVATGNVRSIVSNQAKLKHANKRVHLSTVNHAMRNKFSTASSSICELRRREKELSDVLHYNFKHPKSRCWNIIRTYMGEAVYHKERQKERLNKKFEHCKKRMRVV